MFALKIYRMVVIQEQGFAALLQISESWFCVPVLAVVFRSCVAVSIQQYVSMSTRPSTQ